MSHVQLYITVRKIKKVPSYLPNYCFLYTLSNNKNRFWLLTKENKINISKQIHDHFLNDYFLVTIIIGSSIYMVGMNYITHDLKFLFELFHSWKDSSYKNVRLLVQEDLPSYPTHNECNLTSVNFTLIGY